MIGPLRTCWITVNVLPFLIKNLIAHLGVSLLPLICLEYSFSHSFPLFSRFFQSLRFQFKCSSPEKPTCGPPALLPGTPPAPAPSQVLAGQCVLPADSKPLWGQHPLCFVQGCTTSRAASSEDSEGKELRNTGGGERRERDPVVSLPPTSCRTTVTRVTRVWMLSGSWLPGQDGELRAELGVATVCRLWLTGQAHHVPQQHLSIPARAGGTLVGSSSGSGASRTTYTSIPPSSSGMGSSSFLGGRKSSWQWGSQPGSHLSHCRSGVGSHSLL